MSLAFMGPAGSCERRWIFYALLRDNVQHYLEDGTPSEAFAALHQLASALGGEAVEVSAVRLRNELVRARQLLEKPIGELAVSERSLAVITLAWPPPAGNRTFIAAEHDVCLRAIHATDRTLGDVFGTLVDELIQICGESEEGTVTVHDA